MTTDSYNSYLDAYPAGDLDGDDAKDVLIEKCKYDDTK